MGRGGAELARKNLLANVTSPGATDEAHQARSGYALRGASRSMKLSIDELAANAKRVVAGDSIVELDPTLVDPSALKDRIEDDDEEFILFRDGIRETGQHQPIAIPKKDVLEGFETPKPITSDARNQRYIAALLDMERRGHLSRAEKIYRKLLTVLVEDYEAKRYPIRKASPFA